MKKLFIFLLMFFGLSSLLYFVVNAQSDSGVEVTTNATEHAIKMPYEKSFRFIATMKNNSNDTVNIQIDGEAEEPEEPEGGHILQADRRYRLKPGEENNHIIV